MPACSSCGREISWATMRDTGASMPVDPEPIVLADCAPKEVLVRRRDRLAVVLTEDAVAQVVASPAAFAGWDVFRSHWETCPSRERHRVSRDQGSLFDSVGRGERRRP